MTRHGQVSAAAIAVVLIPFINAVLVFLDHLAHEATGGKPTSGAAVSRDFWRNIGISMESCFSSKNLLNERMFLLLQV